jgi:hypothetical protein
LFGQGGKYEPTAGLIAGTGNFGIRTVGVISDESSPVERLITEFENHGKHEAVFLGRHREMVEKAQNPVVNFLFELIAADEEKHQVVLHAMTFDI